MPFFNIQVPADFLGNERLDKYIASLPDGMNRSKLKSGATELLVNEKKAKLSTTIKANDHIYIQWEENIPEDIAPQNIPLDIIYEDANVTVVNKNQGMVTHPAAGNWDRTLVNALLYHWGREAVPQNKNTRIEGIFSARRPGIVHRLDKDTSGIIITARNRETEEFLSSQFKNHNSISKIYICICQGHPPAIEGVIKTKIIRDFRDRKRFRVADLESDGKIALTKFKCIGCYGPYSLMKLKIYTGRTHQIRVHLKFIGCPILGDPVYSKGTKGTLFEGAPLMLHSYKLKILLPGNEKKTVFKTRVPVRFKKVLKKLHSKFERTYPPEAVQSGVQQIRTSNGNLPLFTAKKGYGKWQK